MPTPTNKPKRRWLPRWSMRVMFFGVTAVCVWFGLVSQSAKEQRRAVDGLWEATIPAGPVMAPMHDVSHVWIGYGFPYHSRTEPGRAKPPGLQGLGSIDYFADVVFVSLSGSCFRDEDLRHVKKFRKLEMLNLSGCDRITDEGMEHLKSLHNLEDLYLNDTSVTVYGLAGLLRALPNCRIKSDLP